MRDRHLLASEVEFLRRQMSTEDRDHKLYTSSSGHMVNEILNTIRYEQEIKEREIIGADSNKQRSFRATLDDDIMAAGHVKYDREDSIETPTEEETDLE